MHSTLSQSSAWNVTPAAYAHSRPNTHAIPEPVSRYLAMRDGCRLAIDVYVPQPIGDTGNASNRYPTITLFTPYYRRFKMDPGAEGERAPNIAKFRDYLVPRGYALVVIDVRGTGASFGTRDSFRSPRERDDSVEVVDWIVAQPWSDWAPRVFPIWELLRTSWQARAILPYER